MIFVGRVSVNLAKHYISDRHERAQCGLSRIAKLITVAIRAREFGSGIAMGGNSTCPLAEIGDDTAPSDSQLALPSKFFLTWSAGWTMALTTPS